ncbi:MAG: hypothetical protein ACXIVD_14365 [Salinarimonas sp.]
MGDTQDDAAQLQQMLAEGESAQVADPVMAAMDATFRRDEIPLPSRAEDGSFPY